MEDYLEAITDLDKEKKAVRVRDIAKRMDVRMPTVTSMLKTLNNRGLVHYEKYEYVELTKDGAKIGNEMRRRHGILMEFLTTILNIEPETANEDACKMEHALSPETMDSLIDFMDFIQKCPRTGESWLNYFQDYRKHGQVHEKCMADGKAFACEFNTQIQSTKNTKTPAKKKTRKK